MGITLHVVNFCVGACLVPTTIFFLLAITQPNRSIHSAVRRIICHQAILIIIMAIAIIRTSFLHLILKGDTYSTDCLATRVSLMLSEGLVGWGQAVLAVYALSLQRFGSVLQNLLSNMPAQVALHCSMWLLVALEAVIIFVPLKGSDCYALSSAGYKVQGYCDLFSDLAMWAALVLYGVRTKRCRRLIGPVQGSSSTADNCRQVTELHQKRRRLSASLVLFCLIVTVLHTAMASLTIYKSDRPGGYPALGWTNTVRTLWYISNFSLVVVLAARHEDLRQQLKRVACRKCFLYGDDTFQHDVHATVIDQCQTMAADPHVQARILSDRRKKASVMSTTPALYRQMSVGSGGRFHPEDSQDSREREGVMKPSIIATESPSSRAVRHARVSPPPQLKGIVEDPVSSNV